MNICLISRESPWGEHTGGIGTYVGTASLLLSQSGHNVHVITCGRPNNSDSDSFCPKKNITVHFILPSPYPLPGHRHLYWYRHFYRKIFPQYLSAISWAMAVRNFYKKLTAVHDFSSVEYPETMAEGLFLNKNKSEKFICRIHSSSMLNIGCNILEKIRLLRIQRATCDKSDLVLSPSLYSKKYYSQRLKRTVEVKNNPYVSQISQINWERKNSMNLAYAGRLEFRKGLQFLLKALNRISNTKFTLDVYGSKHFPKDKLDWKLHNTLSGLLHKEFPLEFKFLNKPIVYIFNGHVVRFWGQLSQSQLLEKIPNAFIFILPSLSENYPYVLLEAMDAGCLCLASKTGGIPEVLAHSSCALQFAPGDEKALANGILQAVDKYQDYITKLRAEKTSFNKIFSTEYQSSLIREPFENEK